MHEERDDRRGLRIVMWLSIHFSIRSTESLLDNLRSAAVLTANVDVTRKVAAKPAYNFTVLDTVSFAQSTKISI